MASVCIADTWLQKSPRSNQVSLPCSEGEPGSPWENGYIESFNGKLRDELLNLEIFDTLYEAQVLIERWRMQYNTPRPHSSLGYRPPAPEAFEPFLVSYGAPPLRPPKTAQILT